MSVVDKRKPPPRRHSIKRKNKLRRDWKNSTKKNRAGNQIPRTRIPVPAAVCPKNPEGCPHRIRPAAGKPPVECHPRLKRYNRPPTPPERSPPLLKMDSPPRRKPQCRRRNKRRRKPQPKRQITSRGRRPPVPRQRKPHSRKPKPRWRWLRECSPAKGNIHRLPAMALGIFRIKAQMAP